MLSTTASVLFAVFALVALLLALVLSASISYICMVRVVNPARPLPVYRLNLYARAVYLCSVVITLAELGAWLAPWIATGEAGELFPGVLWVHLLLIGLLSAHMSDLLESFVRGTSGGRRRFPGSVRRSLEAKATVAVAVAAWLSLVPVLLHLHLPGFPEPNVPVLLPLLAVTIGSVLLVINDDWVRTRLAIRRHRARRYYDSR